MSKYGFFLGKKEILESFDHSNSLKFYKQFKKTYVIQM